MKNKLYKVLGVALPIVMVLALAITLLPANTPTAEAAVGQLRFERIPLPKLGADGNYFFASGTDLGPMAIAADGQVMFATADITDSANVSSLLKSTDGGHTWTLQDDFRDTATDNSDNTTIVAVKLSPDYTSDQTVFVATNKLVYQSVDGGKNFSAMSQLWLPNPIVDMDVALDSTGRTSVIVGTITTSTSTYGGEVYVYSPATTGLSWKAQSIGAYDVLAVAFSPNFAGDEGIFAVTLKANALQTQASFGYTQGGGGWGLSIGPGTFIDSDGDNITATGTVRARIAFPDDFDVDSIGSNIGFVGFISGTTPTAEKGDVYKVTFQSSSSSTEDMNVRGLVSTLRTATNIYSIDVAGDAEAATVLVGTNYWSTAVSNYYWTAYISNDSGETWSSATRMSPTGGATGTGSPVTGVKAEVLLAPDYAASGIAYCATQDSTGGVGTSALSRTIDKGVSWQQISLIDWANTTDNYTISSQTNYSNDNFLIMLVTGTTKYASLFETYNAGGTYERIFSYANEGIVNNMTTVAKTGDYVFAFNYLGDKFWRSSDKGKTFPRIITAKSAMTIYAIVGGDSIWTGHSDGKVWYTANAGRPWVEPDESEIDGSVSSISVSGSNALVSTTAGKLFVSIDGGVNFKRVGVTNVSTGTLISFARDTNYATNKTVFAVVRTANGGVWKIEVNEDDPASTDWERIDTPSTTLNAGGDTVSPYLALLANGVFYTVDTANVTTGDVKGGLWRCTNPLNDPEGTDPPSFKRENAGLTNGAAWTYSTISGTSPYYIYYKSTQSSLVPYYNQLMALSDILNSAVTLSAPADKATGEGYVTSTVDLHREIILTWETKTGATSYHYQVGNDAEFKSLLTGNEANSSTSGTQVSLTNFVAGKTYYWRLRVNAPFESPWSAVRSLTVASVTAVFDISSPARGATNVDITPVLTWVPLDGAISYEIAVSKDSTFATADWSGSSIQTMVKAGKALDYATTYYWRVRGVTGPAPAEGTAPSGAWATGIFTTMAKPVAATPAVIVQKEPAPAPQVQVVQVPVPGPAQAIPDYLLWIVIVVGAVLVIALVVLIVRTRRVT